MKPIGQKIMDMLSNFNKKVDDNSNSQVEPRAN